MTTPINSGKFNPNLNTLFGESFNQNSSNFQIGSKSNSNANFIIVNNQTGSMLP